MNKLLQRQIKKTLGDDFILPENCRLLIDLINETYDHHDNDRKMLERSLEITSEEMIKLNGKLKLESERALSEADVRLKLATDASNVGIWEFDFINNEVTWNETTYKLYGITSQNPIKELEAWKKYVYEDDQLMAKNAMDLAIKGEKDFDIEYRVSWPDNSVRSLRTKGIIQRKYEDKAVKMVGTTWDVTEKRKAQESIRREKELSDSLINSLPVIFFLFNKEGKLLRWNKNLLNITGYTDEEMNTLTPIDFFDDDEKEKMMKEIELVLTTGHSNTESNLLVKSKRKIPYYFNSITINYLGQECIIGTGTNIAERKKMEENLRTKNRDLEEFAHMVSHILRAPIAKIQGLTNLINEDDSDSKENLGLLKYIKDEVVNLDKIIREMNHIIREKEYIDFKKSDKTNSSYSVKIKSVYLIDDDPIVNIVSKKTIEKNRFAEKIFVHQNASNCLNELKAIYESDLNSFPEIIFLDINMPGMNGWEFLDEYKSFDGKVKDRCKIYMLTSSIDPSDIKKSQSYSSVKDFITKPLTKEKLEKLFF